LPGFIHRSLREDAVLPLRGALMPPLVVALRAEPRCGVG